MTGSRRLLLSKRLPAGEPVELVRCSRCGTVFLCSSGDEYVPGLYNYYRDYKNQSISELYPELTDKRYLALLDQFGGITTGRRFLDVGCGLGAFVRLANRNGWKGRGIDLAEHAIDIGKAHGIPVEPCNFFDLRADREEFDLISMFEFIEHVPAPGRFIAHARELLAPGGLLYLTTPNFRSLDRIMQGAAWPMINREHLTYFTPATLRSLVRRNSDLEIIYVRTSNVSLSLLLKLMRSPGEGRAAQEDLRQSFEASRGLALAKRVANGILRVTGLGSAMIMLCRRV